MKKLMKKALTDKNVRSLTALSAFALTAAAGAPWDTIA